MKQALEVNEELQAQLEEARAWATLVNTLTYRDTIQAKANDELSKAITERMNPNTPDKDSLIAVGRGQAWSEVANWALVWTEKLTHLIEETRQADEPEPLDVGPRLEDQWYEKRD